MAIGLGIRLRAAAVFTAVALAVPVTLTATAGTAEAAACNRYRVEYGPAPVHENPWNTSVVRKYKYAGDYVTGPIGPGKFDSASGIWFTQVYTSAATDGRGWMRSAQLGYPMNWNC